MRATEMGGDAVELELAASKWRHQQNEHTTNGNLRRNTSEFRRSSKQNNYAQQCSALPGREIIKLTKLANIRRSGWSLQLQCDFRHLPASGFDGCDFSR